MKKSDTQSISSPTADQSVWKPWAFAFAAAAIIMVVALLLMKSIGLFEIPKDDTGAKTLAAALGLVGAVLSSVVTLIGIVLKFSIDERNAQLASMEASRNFALASQAEQRNRIEAAIRAVDLLGENNKDATSNQMAGSILALVDLGEIDLAVNLLGQLWPTGGIAPSVAEFVTRAGLERGSAATQVTAAEILLQNASTIDQGPYNIWPLGILDWRADLADNCRTGLVRAAVQWLKFNIENRDNINGPVVVLYRVLDDLDKYIVETARAALEAVVDSLGESSSIVVSGNELLSTGTIKNRLASFGDPISSEDGLTSRQEIEKAVASMNAKKAKAK